MAIGWPALAAAPGTVNDSTPANGAAGSAVCAAGDTAVSPGTSARGSGTATAAGSGLPGHGRLSGSVADSSATAVSSTAAAMITNRVIPC